nr:Haloacid dehalogenase-like hydrolase [uncultured bacterium]
MDGVLVDTREFHFDSWNTALAAYGEAMPRDFFEATFARRSKEILQKLLQARYSESFAEEILERKGKRFRAISHGKLAFMTGVTPLLHAFQARHIPQVIASSAAKKDLDYLLDEVQGHTYFDHIVSAATMQGKPAPDVFQEAARVLGVEPHRCLVIEDMNDGAQAAHAASMLCIAVQTSQTVAELPAADWVINRLSDVDADRILDWAEQQPTRKVL